jgi:hypothetical protein
MPVAERMKSVVAPDVLATDQNPSSFQRSAQPDWLDVFASPSDVEVPDNPLEYVGVFFVFCRADQPKR